MKQLNLTQIFFKKNLSKNLITALILSLSLFIITILTIFNDTLDNFISEKILNKNQLNTFTIIPKNDFFSLIQKTTDEPSGQLNPETIHKISNHPNLKTLIPNYTYPSLSKAEIRFGNLGLTTETLIFGTNKQKLSDLNLTDQIWTSPTDQSEPVPAIISQNLIDIFNYSLGPAMGFPEINDKLLSTLNLTVFPNRNQNTSFKVKLIAASNNVQLLGITIPDQHLIELIKSSTDQSEISPSDLTIQLNDSNNLDQFKQFINSLNLNLISNFQFQTNFISSAFIISTSLNFIKFILIISNIFIISILLSNQILLRKKDLAILKLLGASSNFILQTFIGEVLIIFTISLLANLIIFTSTLITIQLLQQTYPLLNSLHLNPINHTINITIFFTLTILATITTTNKVKKLYPIQVLSH